MAEWRALACDHSAVWDMCQGRGPPVRGAGFPAGLSFIPDFTLSYFQASQLSLCTCIFLSGEERSCQV